MKSCNFYRKLSVPCKWNLLVRKLMLSVATRKEAASLVHSSSKLSAIKFSTAALGNVSNEVHKVNMQFGC